jgi:hypothetical protein
LEILESKPSDLGVFWSPNLQIWAYFGVQRFSFGNWSPTLQLWNNFIRYAPKKILWSTQSFEKGISKQNLGTSKKNVFKKDLKLKNWPPYKVYHLFTIVNYEGQAYSLGN